MSVNDEHKDRVFKFIFGNPDHKDWTLALYNAINGSNYNNPDDIEFNTIDDAVYLGMKNDVSFIILDELNLWEHQSTYNPNMPMRFFLYAAKLYEKYIADTDYYPYSTTLQAIPSPRCICFYNGTARQPERKILKLSDAFEGRADIEVLVTMININYGKNEQLMKACKQLNEYAKLVNSIRQNNKVLKDLEAAIDKAIDDMPDDSSIKKFLLLNKAEVKGMFLTEWDQDKVLAQERLDSARRTEKLVNERVARDMLRDGEPLEKIVRYSCLAEEVILTLAKKIGVPVT